jgi:hypothetical protein
MNIEKKRKEQFKVVTRGFHMLSGVPVHMFKPEHLHVVSAIVRGLFWNQERFQQIVDLAEEIDAEIQSSVVKKEGDNNAEEA